MAVFPWHRRRPGRARRFSLRALATATLILGFLGAIGFFAPLDELLSAARDHVRARPADGRIVVLSVDNRTMQRFPSWGLKRALDAEVIERLFAMGASRVFFDRSYADPSGFGDDGVLAAELRRHPGRIFLGARFETSERSAAEQPLLPTPALRSAARIASTNLWVDVLGFMDRAPYASRIGGQIFPSISAALANIHTDDTKTLFRPDFSIRWSSIPTISYADIFDPTPTQKALIKGRDIIVGATADSLGDMRVAPAQGLIPGVYVQVMAAQTLREGRPRNWGSLPALLAAVLAIAAALHLRGLARAVILALLGMALLAAPLATDIMHIRVEVVPAMLLLAWSILRMIRNAALARSESSGLPGPAMLSEGRATCPDFIVAMRIGRYSDLIAGASEGETEAVLTQLRKRLERSGSCRELTHEGDAFVWRSAINDPATIADHLEGLGKIVCHALALADRRFDLQVGIGVDQSTRNSVSNRVGTALRCAQEALNDGVRVVVAADARPSDAAFRLALSDEVEQAILQSHIWVAYQAKLDLRTRAIVGAEALVRWTHPQRGNIRPDEFIPILEATDRLELLTDFVLSRACRTARLLNTLTPGFPVAVNVSVRSLAKPDFVERVWSALTRSDIQPTQLILEITETSELERRFECRRALDSLRALGVAISIDDFGSGYANLEQLKSLRPSELKIDRNLTQDIIRDEKTLSIIQSTIDLGHSLKLRVVAEGVETLEQMICLERLNCDQVQGYFIAKPLRLDDFTAFLKEGRRSRPDVDSHAA